MIYMVDIELKPDAGIDWREWQSEMKPAETLLTVPGFQTAQRFQGARSEPLAYCALYTVDSAEIMTSGTYRSVGGGGTHGSWKPLVSTWHRDLFDGLDRAPKVPDDSVLLVLDRANQEAPAGLEGVMWTKAAGLDRSTPYRGFAIVKKTDGNRWISDSSAKVRVFIPMLYAEKSGLRAS